MFSPRDLCRTLGVLSLAAAAVALPGCTEAAPKAKTAYANLPKRQVPAYMHDSLYENADITGTEPYPVSGYGLVANLHGTGGCQAPTAVRDYMTKELARHQLGTVGNGYMSPDKILDSRDFAIVRVEGLIPPGARAGTGADGAQRSTWFDVRVTGLADGNAASLARGDLYECDLKVGGANPADPGNGQPDVKAQAAGAVFVNPQYVLDQQTDTPAARASRRTGTVLAGARVVEDRPLILRLRTPERRLARAVERRIIERFQDVADDDLQAHGNTAAKKVANAQDEAIIYVYVPRLYVDHWEHFAGIVSHLYLQGGNPAYAALKARELATAAVEPKAPLDDISYAWEGLGKPALFALDPLLTDPHEDVRFAAARAAAFIGDPGAVPVLLDIAGTPGNTYRVNAVQALAELPPSPRIDSLCRSLLDSDQATVRLAAYRLLSKHKDASIFTRWVTDDGKEIFALDVVRTARRAGGGPPLVAATDHGLPRLAVFGTDVAVDLPLIFPSLDDRLLINSTADGEQLAVSYRSRYRQKLVGFQCRPNLPNVVAMMGGDGNNGPADTRLHLGYADVVAVVQSLVDQKKVTGTVGGERMAATFVLGDPTAAPLVPAGRLDKPFVRPESPAGRPLNGADQPAAPDGLLRGPRADATPVH